ncbi:MAG: 2-dehydropantoate 2-reductase [Burkholderiaceae bacterium]|nr:2-dehydropantoate 2-reductase [Burkholderiaceae bacterium]
MGAGSIGCWLGGRLQAAGATVHFVGRPRMLDALAHHGLTLTDRDGSRLQLLAEQLKLHPSLPADLAPDLVLLCVKSAATATAAVELGGLLPPGTPVVSMQNGIGNAAIAQSAAPQLVLLPGMVPFNVSEPGPGHLHRGTDGQLAAQDHPALRPLLPLFAAAGLPLTLHADLRPLQWGKLLLNLNNAVNALSGLPLRAQLLDRDLRCCTAALIAEALVVLRRAGIEPARLSPLPPDWLPWVLRLPTPLFRVLAARMLRIDDQARSSMADDLALGRPTEVDAIYGEVQRLAARVQASAARSGRIAELVKAWPEHHLPVAGRALRRAIGA